eukprot:4334043-Pyramimonas_sp.AAC.1
MSSVWGPPGGLLSRHWGLLGPSWGSVGGLFGHLGAVLGTSWAVVDRLEADKARTAENLQHYPSATLPR